MDKDCRYISVNNALLSRLRLSKDQVLGKTFGELHSPEETKNFTEKVNQVFKTGNIVRYENYNKHLNRWTIRSLSPIKNPHTGEIINISIIAKDITEYKQAEEKIRYISFHDSLTGLYNRAYFEEEMKRVNTKRNYPIAIVMADINGLKVVNDALGHNKGDELLKNTAKVLKSVARKEDIIARIGGDEFAIILPHCDENVAQAFCNRFREACKKCNSELKCSIALGYAI
jgi:diguanylate cyclase (GGDEF)-like protein/PAS domain S-box-containing protein